MALIVATFDQPAGGETPIEVRQRWTETSKAAPGTVSWRVFLNPQETTPQVLILHEFDSMESAMRWLASSERAAITAEARQIGRSSYTVQLWDDAS